MPPIPEDAVVIADYMLMADFVVQASSTQGTISKGCRMISTSRDVFYDGGSAFSLSLNSSGGGHIGGFDTDSGTNSAVKYHLPFFGDAFAYFWRNHTTYAMVAPTLTVGDAVISTNTTNGGSYNTSTGVLTPTGGTRTGDNTQLSGFTLGQTTGKVEFAGSISGNNRMRIQGVIVHTPIHTSSHYQTFETPFLHELV